jgi:hypothetical protein
MPIAYILKVKAGEGGDTADSKLNITSFSLTCNTSIPQMKKGTTENCVC